MSAGWSVFTVKSPNDASTRFPPGNDTVMSCMTLTSYVGASQDTKGFDDVDPERQTQRTRGPEGQRVPCMLHATEAA
jgi:hypothetical protein